MAAASAGNWGLFGGRKNHYIWQDREIRFDMPSSALKLRAGEFVIDTLENVEDTKGNNGERGLLQITNLRLLWQSTRSSRMNLSVGYNVVVSINIRTAASRLRGQAQALYVLTKFNSQRFEFIFTHLVPETPRMFTTIQAVFRAYDTTRLYRDLKLRAALIQDRHLRLLPLEQTYSQVAGVWNLSSEQGHLGTFWLTNVRLVWHANLVDTFNVSIPWLQIADLRLRDSKFGRALVVDTCPRAGGYILGFKVEPPERLQEVLKELESIWKVYAANPILGVQHATEAPAQPLAALTLERRDDDTEVTDEGLGSDALAAYYADEGEASGPAGPLRDIVWSPELGLAVEALPSGVTIDKLWQVI